MLLLESRNYLMGLISRQIDLIKYLVVGGGALVIYILGTSLAVEVFNWPIMPSNIGFYLSVTLFSYLGNYYWSFESSGKHSETLMKYIVLAAIGVVLNMAFIYILTHLLNIAIFMSTTLFCAFWPFVSFLVQKAYVYS